MTYPSKAIFVFAAATLSAGCVSMDRSSHQPVAQALLVASNGQSVGAASVLAQGGQLRLSGIVRNLPPGTHGVHLHTTGRCDGPAFTTAGAHLNPAGHKHGSLNPAGGHLGDLPNLTVASDGTGTVVALIGTSDALFDADGTAIVVHADPDDYRTDPSGNSGPRIACGVLVQR